MTVRQICRLRSLCCCRYGIRREVSRNPMSDQPRLPYPACLPCRVLPRILLQKHTRLCRKLFQDAVAHRCDKSAVCLESHPESVGIHRGTWPLALSSCLSCRYRLSWLAFHSSDTSFPSFSCGNSILYRHGH